MERGPTGYQVPVSFVGERCFAFTPNPLPPNPPVEWTPSLSRMAERASVALGKLAGVTGLLPEPQMFLYSYVRKEAVLSSQIEGTQSSLSELLLFENDAAPGVPLDDVQEVSNYVLAMEHGLRRLRDGFPLSLRLVKEVHGVMLAKGRGSEKQPGEFRTSQNWIGGSRPGNALFVPPPPDQVVECMGALEKFFHEDTVPALTRAGLAHVQFETIHPFLDGNGRTGRLLITLLLCHDGVLAQPLLYLSLFLKQHRSVYYDLLQRVRTRGDWEPWLDFFFHGVEETATQAAETAGRLLQLFQTDRAKLHTLGRKAGSAIRLHDVMQKHPVLTVARLTANFGFTAPTANAAMRVLTELGIVREMTGYRRNRVFSYAEYLRALNEGTESPA
ncbi:Fic family protein [Opitutus terrae]|uniref:Filamentation induced by cAMP protein Fic n=1 Tax=Opitutus terrae (strain DSM 11246 / JCM 15787 / PB90-1) TaxID=452637 RepID=B1ZXR1_OPITP|nr:Fic family protein [Opitutus terrae]ACB74283.1 filamentation induced by cAMP protein Fic [Opitutus terrae PB90-1]